MSWTAICSVFVLTAILPGKAGIPAALVLFHQQLGWVMLYCGIAGCFGSIIFTYLSSWILNALKSRFANQRKGIYIRNYLRRIIKIKNQFGLHGLTLISPIFLSIPLGAFIAKKFYKNNFKIVLYMSVSIVLWSAVYSIVFKFSNLLLDTLLH